MRKCFNCLATTKLHILPVLPEFREKWLQIIPNITSDLNAFRLCSLHFDEKYILTTSSRLRTDAVPSKFLVHNEWRTIEYKLTSNSPIHNHNEIENVVITDETKPRPSCTVDIAHPGNSKAPTSASSMQQNGSRRRKNTSPAPSEGTHLYLMLKCMVDMYFKMKTKHNLKKIGSRKKAKKLN